MTLWSYDADHVKKMSENIPTQSPRRKSKHKYDKLRLPTPPPDPTLPGELQKEADNKNE